MTNAYDAERDETPQNSENTGDVPPTYLRPGVTFTNANTERVKISRALLKEMSAEWSKPVQVKVEGRDGDGDLELVFRHA